MRITVRPARPDLTVPDPDTNRPLPAEGAAVIDNHYWRRRLADGDVVKATRRKRAPKPESPAEG